MNKMTVPDFYMPAISIEQYREISKDHTSPDDLIIQRIFYIERLCRGVIQQELRNTYADKR